MADYTIKDIKYLNKDFSQFRQSLIDFVKTYYKDTLNDFDPSDPAMMYIELASYVGDVLSFYIDSQLKESILSLAEERKNVILLAQALGYRPRSTVPARGDLDVYQLLPSTGTGINIKPDYDYALIINEGMTAKSNNGSDISYRTLQDINFAFSSSYDQTDVSVYQVDTNGVPTFYLLKKSVPIIASTETSYVISITDAERYKKIILPDTNVVSIISVIDSDNNEWNEVPYLAQDTIIDGVQNTNRNNMTTYGYANDTPYLLKYKRVPRRFITRYRSDGKLELQFGAGISDRPGEEIIPNADNVGLAIPSRMSRLNQTWDLSNFIYSDSYGMIPCNTTLTIKYTVGGGIESNVLPNSLTILDKFEYSTQPNAATLDATLLRAVQTSIRVNNSTATTGGRSEETTEEIKNNALSYFAAQDRTVTLEDYVLRAYSMPQMYGSISKAYIVQDEKMRFADYLNMSSQGYSTDSGRIINPYALNLYVLSFNDKKQLINCNDAIKKNLVTYLERHRMLTDAVNIKNAYIINIKVSYDIVVLPNYSAKEVLLKCTSALKDFFNIDKWQINQPIVLADIILVLSKILGVQSILNLKIDNLFDEDLGYSGNVYDIKSATRDNIIYPSLDASIFEVRFPDSDIYGKASTY